MDSLFRLFLSFRPPLSGLNGQHWGKRRHTLTVGPPARGPACAQQGTPRPLTFPGAHPDAAGRGRGASRRRRGRRAEPGCSLHSLRRPRGGGDRACAAAAAAAPAGGPAGPAPAGPAPAARRPPARPPGGRDPRAGPLPRPPPPRGPPVQPRPPRPPPTASASRAPAAARASRLARPPARATLPAARPGPYALRPPAPPASPCALPWAAPPRVSQHLSSRGLFSPWAPLHPCVPMSAAAFSPAGVERAPDREPATWVPHQLCDLGGVISSLTFTCPTRLLELNEGKDANSGQSRMELFHLNYSPVQ